MENPICLKANITKDEAIELIDYLYCEKIDYISYYPNKEKTETIAWLKNGKTVAKWTDFYKNLMISQNILLTNI